MYIAGRRVRRLRPVEKLGPHDDMEDAVRAIEADLGILVFCARLCSATDDPIVLSSTEDQPGRSFPAIRRTACRIGRGEL